MCWVRVRRAPRVLVLALLATVSFPLDTHAQVTTGSIVGMVTDPSGQTVPGAQVSIENPNKGTSVSVLSDSNGSFAAPFLIPGTYTVSVELQGFKKWVRSGIVLQVNERRASTRRSRSAAIEETTTGRGAPPLVRTESSEVGTVIEEKAIRELPLNSRNFASLVYLIPGVTPGQAGENLSGASTFNPRGASNFNALGHQANTNALARRRHRQQRVHVQHRHHLALGGVGARVQGADGRLLRRVRPRRRRGVGVDQVGQQQLPRHGFEYLRDEEFDARNFFVPRSPDGGPKPPLDRHQFGGAVGGPWSSGLYNGRTAPSSSRLRRPAARSAASRS